MTSTQKQTLIALSDFLSNRKFQRSTAFLVLNFNFAFEPLDFLYQRERRRRRGRKHQTKHHLDEMKLDVNKSREQREAQAGILHEKLRQ
jgi:hypothetical protein